MIFDLDPSDSVDSFLEKHACGGTEQRPLFLPEPARGEAWVSTHVFVTRVTGRAPRISCNSNFQFSTPKIFPCMVQFTCLYDITDPVFGVRIYLKLSFRVVTHEVHLREPVRFV